MANEDLLAITEAARVLKCSYGRVRDGVLRGELACVRIGARTFVQLAEAREWHAARTRTTSRRRAAATTTTVSGVAGEELP